MKKTKSTALAFAGAGSLGLFTAVTALAPATRAQALAALCPEDGFDICFPDLDSGAPNTACPAPSSVASDDGAARDASLVTACLGRVCRDAASEPSPGFFEYCCSRGGSEQYDDFCVWVVQSTCSAVAELCAERCPPPELLTAMVALAPPPAPCFAQYPPFIAGVCDTDPFCCATSWDEICAEEALLASPLAEFFGAKP